ncbi:hypothetical protein [Pseudomonas sp. KCJK8927]|uniref:hypothetical protein n=1 Tax=Pseudomonas sp. KCJK8927 TaxID=3344560 RepID=UPI003906CD89
MLDTIHIIDEYLAKPKQLGTTSDQNFTMAGSKPTDKPLGALAIALTQQILWPLPSPIVQAAISSIPSLASLVSGDGGEDQTVRAEKEQLLAAFVERATFSPAQAKAFGYRFQPGHPMAGKSYRRHPLADFSITETENLYIPSESYDSHVMEERESELIRLLVSLGATRISITKMTSGSQGSRVETGGSLNVGPIASTEASYKANSQLTAATTDTRVFNLSGCPWSASKQVDRSAFFWLAFEPSWKAVVFAREHGGCTEASIELKENTSFSEDKTVELSIKAKQMGGSASVGLGDKNDEERTHLISVQFSPIPPTGQ